MNILLFAKKSIKVGVQVSGQGGYPIGYDIFEGNIYEGYTLIPMPHRFEKQFQIQEVTAY